jgi:hypothetical protein
MIVSEPLQAHFALEVARTSFVPKLNIYFHKICTLLEKNVPDGNFNLGVP